MLTLMLIAAMAATSLASTSSLINVPKRIGGQIVRWAKGPAIRLAVSNSLTQPNASIKFNSDVVTAVNKSIEAWQDAADVEFVWESTDKTNASPANGPGDGVSLITIAGTPENVLLFTHDAQNDAAKTRVFHDAKGVITEADIVLNPYQQFSDDGTFGTFDLQATLTHEIGHLLGLKHSAVLGSTMSGSFPKNGLFGMPELAARKLDDSDIAAVRELYNAIDDDLCCAAISGKLPTLVTRPTKAAYVWAEDAETGRVTGLADVGADGAFTIAGLSVGNHNVHWQRFDENGGTAMGDLGAVTLETGDNKLLSDVKIVQRKPAFSIGYIGLNNQLADSAVELTKGQTQTIFIAGSELAASSLTIEASTSSIKVDAASLTAQDLGNGVTVVSVRISLSDQTKPGTYSLIVNRTDGARSALIGALRVD